MHSLAASYSRLNKNLEAIHLYEWIIGLRKYILGDKHPDILKFMQCLTAFYACFGWYQEARQLYYHIVQVRHRLPGSAHHYTIDSPQILTSVSANESTSQEEGADIKAPRKISRYWKFWITQRPQHRNTDTESSGMGQKPGPKDLTGKK